MAETTENNAVDKSTLRENIILRFRKDFIGTLLVSIFLLIGAGRLDWPMAWVYIGVNFLGVITNLIVMVRENPALYAARAQITQEDTKTWDRVIAGLYGPLLLVIMAVIGLDAGRYGWSTVPSWIQYLSIAVFVFGWGFSLWAMVANKYFETSVRIQFDREHETVTSGPYAIVRHPGYLGIILVYGFSPTFLGSLWGLIPVGVLTVMFIVRTALEDKTLHEELPEYPSYAQKVRYRLFPGIW